MADEAWTLLKRIKTVAKALKDFREVRIEAGTDEDVTASNHPALIIRLKSIAEGGGEAVTQEVVFDLHYIFKLRGEKDRVKKAIGVTNDLKNALEGAATIAGFIPEFSDLTPLEAEQPCEHWVMADCVGVVDNMTNRTGR